MNKGLIGNVVKEIFAKAVVAL